MITHVRFIHPVASSPTTPDGTAMFLTWVEAKLEINPSMLSLRVSWHESDSVMLVPLTNVQWMREEPESKPTNLQHGKAKGGR